jgi:hypothetical protein
VGVLIRWIAACVERMTDARPFEARAENFNRRATLVDFGAKSPSIFAGAPARGHDHWVDFERQAPRSGAAARHNPAMEPTAPT